MEYKHIFDKLIDFQLLQSNKSSFSSLEKNIGNIFNFVKIVESLEILAPQINISGSSEVSFNWKENNNIIQVTFTNPTTYCFYLKCNNLEAVGDNILFDSTIEEDLLKGLDFFKREA